MAKSVSYVMRYSRRPGEGWDRVGGVPTHLPYHWPQCHACQERMAFLGQLYASDWFPLHGHLALQFYVCDDCLDSTKPLQASPLPPTAEENRRGVGVRCKSQPRLYIAYEPIVDSMDQWTFNRLQLPEEQLPDRHLRQDKLLGLFPYDGCEGPAITPRNRMVAQFGWDGLGPATVYLYYSRSRGFYPLIYS